MVPTRDGAVKTAVKLDRVVRACGLKISIPKTKFLVAGRNIIQNDLAPISICGGNIEVVSSFHYLGPVMECHSCLNEELTARVSRDAAVFGTLCKSVFSDDSSFLQIFTKRIVYKAVFLGTFLYAVETWSIKQRELHSLAVFDHHCLRTILGISRAQQIEQHISNEDVWDRMGMPVPLGDIISSHRLRW